MAIPAFGALIAEPLYVLTDTAIVGHLGTPQLAGLAVASSVLLTLYAVFIFLAYGTTAAVSRLLGAGDEREAAHQAVQYSRAFSVYPHKRSYPHAPSLTRAGDPGKKARQSSAHLGGLDAGQTLTNRAESLLTAHPATGRCSRTGSVALCFA